MEAATKQHSASNSEVQVYRDIPSEQYHAEVEHTSSSQLVRMLQTPGHFLHHMHEKPEESDLMRMGTAVHCALLEPKAFPLRYVLAPREYDKRLKADKAEIAAIQANYPNQSLVSPSEAATLERIIKGLRKHRMAISLLCSEGDAELSIFWTDPLTDLKLKVRIDKFARLGISNMMVEVKTTNNASPDKFSKKIVEMNYEMRAVMYADALEQAYGIRAQIVWLVIEPETGFIATYKPTLDMIQRGKRRYKEARIALAEARANNHWPSYQAGDSIELIDLPRWAK